MEKFIPTRKIKVEYWYNEDISKDDEFYEQLKKDNKEYFQEFVDNIDKIDTKFNSSSHVEPKEKKESKPRNNPAKEQ